MQTARRSNGCASGRMRWSRIFALLRRRGIARHGCARSST